MHRLMSLSQFGTVEQFLMEANWIDKLMVFESSLLSESDGSAHTAVAPLE